MCHHTPVSTFLLPTVILNLVGSPFSGVYQNQEMGFLKLGKNSLPDSGDHHKNVYEKRKSPLICKNDFVTLLIVVIH